MPARPRTRVGRLRVIDRSTRGVTGVTGGATTCENAGGATSAKMSCKTGISTFKGKVEFNMRKNPDIRERCREGVKGRDPYRGQERWTVLEEPGESICLRNNISKRDGRF